MSDRLMNGEKLERGQSLTSRNGAYTLTLQDDGNLVLAAQGEAVWATDTNGKGAERLEVQKDGNCVLYTSDKPIWHTDTNRLCVRVRDAGGGDHFQLEVAPAEAMDVFDHPYAYAAARGIRYCRHDYAEAETVDV